MQANVPQRYGVDGSANGCLSDQFTLILVEPFYLRSRAVVPSAQQRHLHITCPQYRNLTERYKHVHFSKMPTKISLVFRALNIRNTQAHDRQIALVRRLFWIVLKFKVRVLEANWIAHYLDIQKFLSSPRGGCAHCQKTQGKSISCILRA